MRPARGSVLRDERGAAPVEALLVGLLLTALTLGILQFALAVYVRNTVHDAAVEGAFHAALADRGLGDGVARTRELIARAVSAEYADDVDAAEVTRGGVPVVEVTVRTTLPIAGLFGPAHVWEVSAHAPIETFDAPPG